ncbi:hypothetical protein [Cloacibacterium sp.]|uniref:hypothetical protein n=1 Tax=Cloacibacterium sp. TaxID=1913682 RepID=UPI00352D522A
MQKEMKMQVTAELAVSILPNAEHEFLMTTKEVAHGYGTSEYVIRRSKSDHSAELIEGKHFIKGVDITPKGVKNTHTLVNAQPHQVFWTKRGIIRLGFFIKSKQAILFRDWAEDLIINVLEAGENFLQPVPVLQAPKKRNHNRLTQDRMISILADVAKIEDSALRLSLISKLGV